MKIFTHTVCAEINRVKFYLHYPVLCYGFVCNTKKFIFFIIGIILRYLHKHNFITLFFSKSPLFVPIFEIAPHVIWVYHSFAMIRIKYMRYFNIFIPKSERRHSLKIIRQHKRRNEIPRGKYFENTWIALQYTFQNMLALLQAFLYSMIIFNEHM